MPKRSVSWNDTLSEKLSDLDFAKNFPLDLMEEGLSLQEELEEIFRGHGVKEFCTLVDLKPSSVQRAINLKNNSTKATLETLLEPLGPVLRAKEIKRVA